MGISISLCFFVVAFPQNSPIPTLEIVRVVASFNYYIIRLWQARVKCLFGISFMFKTPCARPHPCPIPTQGV